MESVNNTMARFKKRHNTLYNNNNNKQKVAINHAISHKRLANKPGAGSGTGGYHNFIKSIKNPSHFGGSLPAFFQKNYAANCQHIQDNTTTGLKTLHKSYYPTQDRIIVIGDIHGDLDKLYDCLLLAKVIQPGIALPPINSRTNQTMFEFFNRIQWTGGNTHVVQLGDQIDRIRPTKWDSNSIPQGTTHEDEGSSLHIFYLLWHLNHIAKRQGGKVICVMGNHEFMNVDGDFRYVSPHEFNEYYQAFEKFNNGTREDDDPELLAKITRETQAMQHPPPVGYKARRIAWHPKGIIANFLALNYKTMVQIGKWVFVHAGLTMHVVKDMSICAINNNISKYLLMDSPCGKNNLEQQRCKSIYNKYINCAGDKCPVWNRDFGEEAGSEREAKLLAGKYDMIMQEYNRTNRPYHEKYGVPAAHYLAIGHTPQFYSNKGINGELDGRVWRCDVGMSRAFGGTDKDNTRRPQVLEIRRDDTIQVLG